MAQGVPSTSYQYAGEEVNPKMPSCRSSKEKNYTRTYRRVNNKKHKALPWSTVYVVLTLKPDGDISPDDEEHNLEIIKEMNAKRHKTSSNTSASANAVKKEENNQSTPPRRPYSDPTEDDKSTMKNSKEQNVDQKKEDESKDDRENADTEKKEDEEKIVKTQDC